MYFDLFESNVQVAPTETMQKIISKPADWMSNVSLIILSFKDWLTMVAIQSFNDKFKYILILEKIMSKVISLFLFYRSTIGWPWWQSNRLTIYYSFHNLIKARPPMLRFIFMLWHRSVEIYFLLLSLYTRT